MKIALTQIDIVWENKEKNKLICERLADEAAKNKAELIVFPEMTLTGFTMNTEYAGEKELEGGETVEFFKELSLKKGIDIIFGMVHICDRPYNLSVFIEKGRLKSYYRKIHPFSYGGETDYYGKGDNIIYADYKDEILSMFVCYDLRFPEIFQIASKNSKIITVIANWPASRKDHWDTLLKARAIENQSFVIGVNRTGEGNGLKYAPSSVVYSPYGERITETADKELIYADIDVKESDKYRSEFPLKNDRREDIYLKLKR